MDHDKDPATNQGGRLRPDKHAAIIAGGREVFAREQYQRASIDAIATASRVSTRTIYKHFVDKAALFAAVVAESSADIAEEQLALIDHHLSDVSSTEELEPALAALATEWLRSEAPAAHTALVGQVHAEASRLGTDIVTTYWQAGPGRVIEGLAKILTRWSEAGLLNITHPERAAIQFAELISARPGPPSSPLAADEQREWIDDGVGVFIRAYNPSAVL